MSGDHNMYQKPMSFVDVAVNRDDIQLPEGYEPHELPADYDGPLWTEGQVWRFAEMVAAAEREACALAVERSLRRVDGSHGVEHHTMHIADKVVAHCAEAIRARNKT